MHDDPLRERLRQIPATVEFPQDFSRSVWSRIESIESSRPFLSRWKIFTDWLSRPLPAFATVAIMLVAGSAAGVERYRREHAQELQTAYLRAISPFDQNSVTEAHLRP